MTKSPPIPCFHCGEDCGSNPVVFNDKNFCCYGCKMVYEILSESDACEYYSIENHPGIKINVNEIGNKFAYLDNEEIKSELLDFSDGGISKIKFFVPAIHCSSCIWLLENLHRLEKGVKYSSVNFIKKEVSITFKEEEISLRKLVELLASINYVPQITLDDLKNKSEKKLNRVLYYKLGIAGFCFGNIMLFSFPEYLAVDHFMEETIRIQLSWLNLFLAIPVLFYAASDYLVSAVKGLRKKIVNIDVPIALGIIVLFIRSAYEIISGTGAGYMDSLSGLVFFLLIGKWYQGKTYQALSFERDYKSYFPVAITVLAENDEEEIIPLKKLKAGHRILVRNQELIPADAILIKGDANIDYSFVSGESTPVPKMRKDLVFAGGRQLGSSIELIVEKEVSQSYLTELWNQDLHSYGEGSRTSSVINVVSQYFTISIVSLAILTAIVWAFVDPSVVLNAFSSILSVACPCALALTIPFTFGNTMRIFGRNGFYVKKTDVIEELSKTDTIVFDKTGTITQNNAFSVESKNIQLDQDELHLVKAVVRHSTHPMSTAIYRSIEASGGIELDSFVEIPGLGIEARKDDTLIKVGSEKFITGSSIPTGSYATRVYVSFNDDKKGYFLINNKYRPGLKAVINDLEDHFELFVLSGDNDSELNNLLPLFKNADHMRFRQSPGDKLEYIRKLREEGKKVIMIGDGLNDAGALQESEVGITIADDIYHFSPACDGILESKQFSSLSRFIRFTKISMKVVYVSFIISFIYNVLGISFAAMGYLTPIVSAILMPLSSVSVVVFVTITTTLLAKRAGFKLTSI
ncbi:MAG: heavy metal translocating P-type ATPase [Bacteroidetes bacterium]|nr:MAG: heavy metal translocating P-type ATPase [Bacteroidota bacterium]